MSEWTQFDWGVLVGTLIGAFGTLVLVVTVEAFGVVEWLVTKIDVFLAAVEEAERRRKE